MFNNKFDESKEVKYFKEINDFKGLIKCNVKTLKK